MMSCGHVMCVILLFNMSSVNCARILAVFPTITISHQLAFRPLTQELAKRGHQVTVITPDPAFPKGEYVENIKEIDVHDSYKLRNGFYEFASSTGINIYIQISVLFHGFAKLFEEQLRNAEVTALINNKNETYDLLILEACNRASIALSHIYKVPTLQISSFGSLKMTSELHGMPTHPLLYPTSLVQILQNLTFWDKINVLYNHYCIESIIDTYKPMENKLMKLYFGDDLPSIEELSNKLDMLFLNVHSVWENYRPVPSSVVYLGNMHQVNESELPEDLKTYMDSCDNGIIYFSFGTNVKCSMLANDLVEKFLNVFSKLPYNVLWRCDITEFKGNPKNIKTSEWFPQSDLLKHPNIKLFITQGGIHSTDEAIAAGVPLIGIPWLGDQWYNVERYVYYKIGIKLDKEILTEEKLLNAINTVIDDSSYRRNVVKLRSIMYDQPQRSLQRAVWWIEHVLQHGTARHLRTPAANISLTEYFELELLLIVVISIITALIIISSILNNLYSKIKTLYTKPK